MRRVIFGVSVLGAFILSACGVKSNTVVMSDVDLRGWQKTATITYDNTSLDERQMSVMLHVNSKFDAECINLEVKMLTPDSLCYEEQVKLTCPATKKIPTAGSIDIEIPYRYGVRLRKKGLYTFELTPTQSVAGIEAIGINFQSDN